MKINCSDKINKVKDLPCELPKLGNDLDDKNKVLIDKRNLEEIKTMTEFIENRLALEKIGSDLLKLAVNRIKFLLKSLEE